MKQAGFEQVGGGNQGFRVDHNLIVVINRKLTLLLLLLLYKVRYWINEYEECNFGVLFHHSKYH